MYCASGRRHSKKVLSVEKCAAHSREPTNLPEKEAHFKAQEQKVTLCIIYFFHIQHTSLNFICLFTAPLQLETSLGLP